MEVDEVALGSLRSEVAVVKGEGQFMRTRRKNRLGDSPWMLAGGADARREHEVERLRLCDLIASVWICDLVVTTQLTQFWARIIVELGRHGNGERSHEGRSMEF